VEEQMRNKHTRVEQELEWVEQRLDAQDKLLEAMVEQGDILSDMIKDIMKIIELDKYN